ncbi:DNA-binding MarR family transcriptional regulator [Microbacterium resistens]|uniref:DNA-binding MarR family transcriptional regulator n=1 Tax=Microbacterium resistens TaxID=156977 RepID=A0ABU1SH53_9MICO|nr:MarR family transcriptional regulator [Microbacterium resistens]MDR6868930.1 DNA-binding MarR family transcriptional regulator [Microbacterium resistens]
MDDNQLASRVRQVVHDLKRRFREAGRGPQFDAYGPQQQDVLYRISYSGPSSITELATAERVRHQSMAETVASLRDKGLITVARPPHDRRQVHASITPEGQALIDANFTQRDQWFQSAVAANLTDEEQALLERAVPLLERIARSQ